MNDPNNHDNIKSSLKGSTIGFNKSQNLNPFIKGISIE